MDLQFAFWTLALLVALAGSTMLSIALSALVLKALSSRNHDETSS